MSHYTRHLINRAAQAYEMLDANLEAIEYCQENKTYEERMRSISYDLLVRESDALAKDILLTLPRLI